MGKQTLCAMALLVLSGCFKLGDKSAAPVVYVKSTYALPKTMDPAQMNDGVSLAASELVYEGLLRIGPSFDVIPALAASWEIDSTGTKITFNLRQGAKFHDGSAVTADDVVASLKRLVKSKSVVSKHYDVVVGSETNQDDKVGIRKLSPSKIEIQLKKKFPPFLYIVAGATAKVFPKDKLSNPDFFKNPIGAGPFKFESRTDDRLSLSAFDGYYGGKAKLNELVLEKSDQTTAMKKALVGDIHDLSLWPFSGKEDVFKAGQKFEAPVAETWIVGLNVRRKPFNDVRVRKKFKKDFDGEGFRKKFYPNASAAYGYIPPAFPGHMTRAQEIPGESSNPPKSKVELYFPQGLGREKEMVQFIESTMREKGWNIEVRVTEWNAMMKLYAEKKMPAFVVSMNTDYPSPEFLLENFYSTNSDNFSGVKDKKLDQLLDQAQSVEDRKERQKIYIEAAHRVNDLAVTVNLFHPMTSHWVNSCVEGFSPNLLSANYIDYRKVGFKKGCTVKGAKK